MVRVLQVVSTFASICTFPPLPRLVVINTTPLAPREPQIAVAEASLSTVKDSISSILSSFILRSNPSTKIKALEPAPNVEIPRIQNSEILFPGCPEVWRAITPAMLPAKALVMLDVEVFSVFISTLVTAPVIVIFFCAPVPVTTTSSKAVAVASFIMTLIVLCSFIRTSCFSKPMKEKTSLWQGSILILNLPSMSVMAPNPGMSLMITLTPINGSLDSSVTRPSTSILFVCTSTELF